MPLPNLVPAFQKVLRITGGCGMQKGITKVNFIAHFLLARRCQSKKYGDTIFYYIENKAIVLFREIAAAKPFGHSSAITIAQASQQHTSGRGTSGSGSAVSAAGKQRPAGRKSGGEENG
jgi:hypothetical protein